VPILAIIFGILLILFGGGCTLIMGGIAVYDVSSIWNDLPDMLSIMLPLGILPLVIGILLVRWGLKTDRERRQSKRNP